jgi:hypothetical protein
VSPSAIAATRLNARSIIIPLTLPLYNPKKGIKGPDKIDIFIGLPFHRVQSFP